MDKAPDGGERDELVAGATPSRGCRARTRRAPHRRASNADCADVELTLRSHRCSALSSARPRTKLQTAENVTNLSRARFGQTAARRARHRASTHRRASNADTSSTRQLSRRYRCSAYHRGTCPWAKLQTAENVTNSSRARPAARAPMPRTREHLTAAHPTRTARRRADFAIGSTGYHPHACPWAKLQLRRDEPRGRDSVTRARPSAHARAPHRALNADRSSTA